MALASCLGPIACGGAKKDASTSAPAITASPPSAGATTNEVWGTPAKHESKLDADRDNDNPKGGVLDEDDEPIIHYGKPVTGPELKQMRSWIEGYYRAAVAHDGAAACRLLYSVLAESLGEEPENPHPKASANCATFAAAAFTARRRQLAGEARRLSVAAGRAEGDRAWAVLAFGRDRPPGRLLMHREHGIWKVNQLVRLEMP